MPGPQPIWFVLSVRGVTADFWDAGSPPALRHLPHVRGSTLVMVTQVPYALQPIFRRELREAVRNSRPSRWRRISRRSCARVFWNLGGQLDVSRHISTLRNQRVRIPLNAQSSGHYFSSAGSFGWGRSKSAKGLTPSDTFFGRFFSKQRPYVPNGGLRLPPRGRAVSLWPP